MDSGNEENAEKHMMILRYRNSQTEQVPSAYTFKILDELAASHKKMLNPVCQKKKDVES